MAYKTLEIMDKIIDEYLKMSKEEFASLLEKHKGDDCAKDLREVGFGVNKWNE